MRRLRIGSVLLCLLLLVTSASANSAQTRWDGTDATGAIISDADCPVVVEHELLTFDISEFPRRYYSTYHEHEADFQTYSARVTAQYTFYNPADYTVTAKLLFPFGCQPDYADPRYTGADTDKYGAAVNGETVPTTLRHSYARYAGQFELERDLAYLHDGFVAHDFYSPDTTVTKYTYAISGVDTQTYPAADVAFAWTPVPETKLLPMSMSGFQRQEDTALVATGARAQRAIELYAIGEPLAQPLEWKAYSNGALDTEIDGTVTLTSTETTTFRDWALSAWSEDSGVSESDWYNAVVADLDRSEQAYGTGLICHWEETSDLSLYLMRWYEYEITLEPGQRITNTVTAPMYPAINGSMEPPVYTYTYLLSPAKTWVDFGELEIVVNTPYYMLEEGMDGFERTETGYTLIRDGLPDGELEFSLCSGANPKKPINWSYLSFFLVIFGIPILIVVLVVVLIIRKIVRRRSTAR